MSSVSKEYGREYYTAATYSYRVPTVTKNYYLTPKNRKMELHWRHSVTGLPATTELIEEAYDTHQSPLGIKNRYFGINNYE